MNANFDQLRHITIYKVVL